MLISRIVVRILAISMAAVAADIASAQDYPNKAVRIITTGAGSSGDALARLFAPPLSTSLGQTVVVENRGGVATPVGVAQAAPDGYTLLLFGAGLWRGPLLIKAPYDAVKDFAPISMLAVSPNILVVTASLPVNSVKDLIALAKAKPGELNYTAAGTGGASHLSAELFKAMAGVNIVRISYKSPSQEATDLISGQVQLTFGDPAQFLPLIKAGKLKALAVTTLQPSLLAPGMPTVAASGVPGFESVQVQGIWAPAHTPEAIINRLSQATIRVLGQTDIKERFLNAGVEPFSSSPEQFAAKINSDIATMSKVIKDAGITAD